MSKGNKISDAEVYCIEKMTMEGKSVDEISDFIKRDARTVKKYSDSVEVIDKKTEDVEKYAKSDNKNTHFLHTTAEKNSKGVTIMTPNESARADETRHLRLSQDTKRNVHKISKND
jgi:hypothetical protein